MKLTKTDLVVYIDAPNHLWAIKHNKLDQKEIGTYLQHLFEQGYDKKVSTKEIYISIHKPNVMHSGKLLITKIRSRPNLYWIKNM